MTSFLGKLEPTRWMGVSGIDWVSYLDVGRRCNREPYGLGQAQVGMLRVM